MLWRLEMCDVKNEQRIVNKFLVKSDEKPAVISRQMKAGCTNMTLRLVDRANNGLKREESVHQKPGCLETKSRQCSFVFSILGVLWAENFLQKAKQ